MPAQGPARDEAGRPGGPALGLPLSPGGAARELPLAGVTVVSVEQAVAAPFATRQLADLGARVIKVERPGAGDFARNYDAAVKGLASYFVWLNRGKQSLSLDLKSAASSIARTCSCRTWRRARPPGWACRPPPCAVATGGSSSATSPATRRTGPWTTGGPTTC